MQKRDKTKQNGNVFSYNLCVLFCSAACSNSGTRRRPAILSALSGTIKSPGFPDNYPSPSTCRWKILVPAGKRIRLVFNSFNVEKQADCTYDYLQIHDGGADSARSMGRFCGENVPEPLITSGNMAFLYFKYGATLRIMY
ncbi:tolloid-like protein 2 [Branchiostoma floridae]|uniref:Tolloid-like protein 2 n=1 Tax=Branchiostoma floridae TaxID=7739 RepID=A0A9J7N4C7_BRAFL|nr:tolloid-like protein 2 [Branchiostoma floridae]